VRRDLRRIQDELPSRPRRGLGERPDPKAYASLSVEALASAQRSIAQNPPDGARSRPRGRPRRNLRRFQARGRTEAAAPGGRTAGENAGPDGFDGPGGLALVRNRASDCQSTGPWTNPSGLPHKSTGPTAEREDFLIWEEEEEEEKNKPALIKSTRIAMKCVRGWLDDEWHRLAAPTDLVDKLGDPELSGCAWAELSGTSLHAHRDSSPVGRGDRGGLPSWLPMRPRAS
jgi:hypothetical protein